MSTESNRNKFLATYNGRSLLQQYAMAEKGMWEIYGEDPNCDMGGSHHQPRLGTVEGTFSDVLDYAVELSGFWQWGAGGDIKKVSGVIKLDGTSQARIREMKECKRRLEDELYNINEQLKKMGVSA